MVGNVSQYHLVQMHVVDLKPGACRAQLRKRGRRGSRETVAQKMLGLQSTHLEVGVILKLQLREALGDIHKLRERRAGTPRRFALGCLLNAHLCLRRDAREESVVAHLCCHVSLHQAHDLCRAEDIKLWIKQPCNIREYSLVLEARGAKRMGGEGKLLRRVLRQHWVKETGEVLELVNHAQLRIEVGETGQVEHLAVDPVEARRYEHQPPVRTVASTDIRQALQHLEVVIGLFRQLVPELDPGLEHLVRCCGIGEASGQTPVPRVGVAHLRVRRVHRRCEPLAVFDGSGRHVALSVLPPVPLPDDLVEAVVPSSLHLVGAEEKMLQPTRS
mmetsp:Transcript_31591/g.87133  ORF Transcript_31591/g.87133 Transcript_31591/m.87133 type:complete len:330 (-) Transcript_31591:486-1475(-)